MRAIARDVVYTDALVFDIGSSLREARTRQGLDLNEMEFRTKVRAKYLRALEADQFDQLPGHTYIKGFLRTYADSLGMDGQLYVDEYNSRYVAGEEDQPLRTRRVPSQGRRQRQHRESRLVAIAVTAMVLLTALVIAAWKFGGTEEPKVQGVNVPPAATPSAVAKGVVGDGDEGSHVHGGAGGIRRPASRSTAARSSAGRRSGSPRASSALSVASPAQRRRSRRRGARQGARRTGSCTITPRS